ncbi:hypothetical protein DM02DRAFT_719783 [Periconia macrospinosa]|uniref:DUF7703 domain-containing protein n=1 Tax=Periconia macrospinosa TaxID=97972 RepID=A0A2V1DHJ2_9PLEO|nr:hypothetical protein DM02DRAFT_719783 [Periconia macrospinosa]
MANANSEYGKKPLIPFHIATIIASFIGISFYNVIELNVIILNTFKNRRCLYFWSFIFATWGIMLWSLGFLIKDFGLESGTLLYSIFIATGWCAMVTGQSCVLYSRLHIVLDNRTYLRLVLAMIIFNAIVLHVPTIVLGFGAQSNNPGIYLKVYPIYEKVHVTIFFFQELVISMLYIIYTAKHFGEVGTVLGKTTGNIKHHLILINALVIALDITILGLEYSGYYDVQTAYKGMVYSIKLKLEFRILNDLADIVKSRHPSSSYMHYGGSWADGAAVGPTDIQLPVYMSDNRQRAARGTQPVPPRNDDGDEERGDKNVKQKKRREEEFFATKKGKKKGGRRERREDKNDIFKKKKDEEERKKKQTNATFI